MAGALLGPLIYQIVFKKMPKSATLSKKLLGVYLAKPIVIGGILSPVAVALHSRIYEGRFV
jgi:hypothetical protein